MARFFGPITAVWFLVLAGLGVYHIVDDPSIVRALLPHHGIRFLLENGFIGFIILGSVFLAVTGAEALYADMGHFGKKPIRVAWLGFVLPCLLLNYLGQGALVLAHPAARANPFFDMIPQAVYWPVLLLATVATVIASQAVITGAFSMTQQAVQLGLFPRIDIRRTSETQAGQIFVPQVNTFLLIGVLILLFTFRSSSNLAAAYGIAVTGAMFVDTPAVLRHRPVHVEEAGVAGGPGGRRLRHPRHRLHLLEPAEDPGWRLAAPGPGRGACRGSCGPGPAAPRSSPPRPAATACL